MSWKKKQKKTTRQKRSRTEASGKLAPIVLHRPHRSTEWRQEPALIFADGMSHPDPKVGIPLYGPRSLGTARHKREVHVGFIGTADAVANAQQFYAECSEGVDGDVDHAPFPGCQSDRGYRCELRTDKNLVRSEEHTSDLQSR